MDKVTAAKQAIDVLGSRRLAEKLTEVTGTPVTQLSVRMWRQRGVPGAWVPAVCALTGASEKALNPLAVRRVLVEQVSA